MPLSLEVSFPRADRRPMVGNRVWERAAAVERFTPPVTSCRALVSMADYGIILASNGREIYFHRNSLLGADFDRFEASGEDRIAEEQDGNGLGPVPYARPANITW